NAGICPNQQTKSAHRVCPRSILSAIQIPTATSATLPISCLSEKLPVALDRSIIVLDFHSLDRASTILSGGASKQCPQREFAPRLSHVPPHKQISRIGQKINLTMYACSLQSRSSKSTKSRNGRITGLRFEFLLPVQRQPNFYRALRPTRSTKPRF